MANSLISMIKGDSTLIDNTEVLDGQLLFDETKQKIFLDNSTERKEYGGSSDDVVKKDDVAYIESAMVATRGYSAGNYIIVQDTLYKTTTQINSGTVFVVGTNVTITTVGSEITQLINSLAEVNNDLATFSFRDNNGQAQYSMDGGITWRNFKYPVGSKSITANGSYDVTDYAVAEVNVTITKNVRVVLSVQGHLQGVANTTATVKWWGTVGVQVYVNNTLTSNFTLTSGVSQADARSISNTDNPTTATSSDKTY